MQLRPARRVWRLHAGRDLEEVPDRAVVGARLRVGQVGGVGLRCACATTTTGRLREPSRQQPSILPWQRRAMRQDPAAVANERSRRRPSRPSWPRVAFSIGLGPPQTIRRAWLRIASRRRIRVLEASASRSASDRTRGPRGVTPFEDEPLRRGPATPATKRVAHAGTMARWWKEVDLGGGPALRHAVSPVQAKIYGQRRTWGSVQAVRDGRSGPPRPAGDTAAGAARRSGVPHLHARPAPPIHGGIIRDSRCGLSVGVARGARRQ